MKWLVLFAAAAVGLACSLLVSSAIAGAALSGLPFLLQEPRAAVLLMFLGLILGLWSNDLFARWGPFKILGREVRFSEVRAYEAVEGSHRQLSAKAKMFGYPITVGLVIVMLALA